MHCVKLPGQCLSARDFDRQVAEFQDRSVRGKVTSACHPICATEPIQTIVTCLSVWAFQIETARGPV
jgi:hypothetical protein